MSNPYAPPDDRPGADTPERRTPPHAPEPGWGVPPAQQPVAPPPRETPPPSPETVKDVARQVRLFAVLMLATLLTGTFPVPWQAASLVFCVLALVVGIRALVRAVRGRVRGAMTGLLAGGTGLAAFWLVVSGGMILMWPLYLDRQECLAGALTVSARHECEATFEKSVQDWLDERTGR
ncbi:hypothetical protein [Cellulomonas palmilytica]|uniref:hypothetical protein n=1 Tax=Cellulomonas palmilytica TaxID=2608402 RepID=UPI001F402D74|nr:hypothetical protein [Cellulomonas palmilytica]UJP39703.1 hypothetical protein F1D97_15605 [Cellulomonas palmilytica]